MYPGDAEIIGRDEPAIVMTTSGAVRTWGELDDRSNRLAQYWFSLGLRPGDHVALLMENVLEFAEVCWAAERSGLYYTPINSHLTAAEVAYILADCGAQSLVTTAAKSEVAIQASQGNSTLRSILCIGDVDGCLNYEVTIESFSNARLEVETSGAPMLYSSGTTGVPKGVIRPLANRQPGEVVGIGLAMKMSFGGRQGMRYLSPAPMYHSAPLTFLLGTHRLGGTVYVMERFDAPASLQAIETYRITHSQWVPTMFSRMLKLSNEVRDSFDLSSHEFAIHGAAPCPIPLKKQMIDWWGPIIWEYYAGTEGPGSTAVGSDDWLRKPGTVGRSFGGVIHILNEEGEDQPTGESGVIYFESPTAGEFTYHGDASKTASAKTSNGWATMGDIGYLDEEGFLYLTDRKSFTIISGGVNIYPQEAENVLAMHPAVADVGVFGIPHEDMGESVHAVVQLAEGIDVGPTLESDLIEYCRSQLSKIKCPTSISFQKELPRLQTGKLYKKQMRDEYLASLPTRPQP